MDAEFSDETWGWGSGEEGELVLEEGFAFEDGFFGGEFRFDVWVFGLGFLFCGGDDGNEVWEKRWELEEEDLVFSFYVARGFGGL